MRAYSAAALDMIVMLLTKPYSRHHELPSLPYAARYAAWSSSVALSPEADASSMLRASMQSTLRSWA
eukprot:CAMPEP_0175901370 /NCGR_PEP_ID=MMETSP0108-20121206/2829_1 /TAXON_ID=195067 ORGANISM="Goniomonas pacifica, Strain CCMP1869" /NCGR_SAMPLE_ID=MMETSP0108 /ASSEMBLY_ACC=CAM_ASM_000204 /LENGTH=66 /DNA_ID=CAMNT_0017222955 /DNA_START=229 /DNA_END=429 /DNA_ORIENTATION=+